METLTIIGFFVLVFVIVLIVYFIGNHIVDGAQNAITGRRAKNRKIDPRDRAVTESLAQRYSKEESARSNTQRR